MDAHDFPQLASADESLRKFLQDVAAEASPHVETVPPQQYATIGGLDFLGMVAAYALFRWCKIYLDHRRQQSELDLARQQLQIVREVAEQDGLPADKVRPVVEKLLDKISKRSADDPALQAALKLIGKGK
jgi:hypothetical protein